MKPGIPWSIKGIESETREVAKAAAQRSGMTLGQWLNGMIQEGAESPQEDRKPVKKSAKKNSGRGKKHKKAAPQKSSKIDDRLAELADQLTALSEQGQATAVNRFVGYDNEPAAGQALEAMIERIERGEAQTHESFAAVNTRLDTIDAKLTGPTEDIQDQSPGFQALETALRNIVDHIETSEKRNRDALGNMQERMSEMTKRAEQAQSTAVTQNAPALAALDARVAELALQHEQAANSSQSETRSYLEERLSRIGEQIDAVRHSSDAMTKRAEISAVDAAKKETREVEQRVASLIGEARTLMVKSANPGGALDSIRGEIDSLNQRFDDIKTESASDQDVQSLKLAIEQLTSSVSAGHDMQPIAAMEQRLGELTHRLDQTAAGDHIAPQLAELEQRIISLDQQLVTATEKQGDAAAFTALESQISMIGERMSATEQKLGALTTIEQSISQLYGAIEDNREDNRTEARTIAEGAVTRMTGEIMQQGAPIAAPAGPSPELIALEEGLAAVRQSSQIAEQHNQETLEAVHETLEQIITKLADMEARDVTAPATEPQLEQQPEQQQAQQPETGNTDWQAAVQSHLQDSFVSDTDPGAAVPATTAPSAAAPMVAAPDIFAHEQSGDVPPAFDPGPLPQMPEQPEMPAPAAISDPAVSAMSDPASQSAGQAPLDYIAQARLASKTASTQAKNPLTSGAGFFSEKIMAGKANKNDDDEPDPATNKKSLFSLPFLTKKTATAEAEVETTADNDQPEVPTTKNDDPKSSRKRLLLAGLMLLIAAGSFAFSKVGSTPVPKPVPTATLPGKVTPPKAAALPEKTSHTTLGAKNLVKPVSRSVPQTSPPPTTADQTGMPAAQALQTGNQAANSVTSVPVDPILTSSLPPAPRAAQTPLSNSQTTARSNLPAGIDNAETPAGAVDTSFLPEAVGTPALRQAAFKGNSSAQFVVATRYVNGKQLKRDYAKAAVWYQRAATGGLAPAQYRLGTLFERGNGVPKDLNAARLWYERAAESGNVKAMHNLAVIYASPNGGLTDYAKAMKWFEKASNFGLKDSQYNLAVIHERGLIGQPNQKEAFYWYSLAASDGDRDARVKAHSLKNYLPPSDIKAMDQRRAAWKPQQALKTGNFVAIKDPKWRVASKPTNTPPQLGAKPNLSGKVLIRQTQTLLSRLGFDIGSTDGVMGSRTANAVRLFQLQNGLQVNGMVTNDLLQQLQARS